MAAIHKQGTHLDTVRRACRQNLLQWFSKRKRALPWRKRRTAYRVWLAEIMLQQTQVAQVKPYYDRFLRKFPSLKALARGSRQDVLKCWEGLGYYARARRLHETAEYLVTECGGRFPRTYEGLLALPGVGPYTAAAVGSIAMGLDVAVVDGNVARVLSRLFAMKDLVSSQLGKRRLQEYADALLVKGRSAEYNEAMMELGALCCVPREPVCHECPLRRVCRGHASGAPEHYPVKPRRTPVPHKIVGAGAILNRQGRLLIAQRRSEDMLGGLWEFPGGTLERGETMAACIARELKEELDITVEVGEELIVVPHAYSHFTMDLHVHWCRIRKGKPRVLDCADFKWVPVSRLREYPMSKADDRVRKAIEQIKERPSG